MTIKELKDWFGKYPDDAVVHARVVARNGRGGTFEEQLLLTDSHHDEKENVVYVNCGFEIGWLDNHPEFQPPAEPEARTDDEARKEILDDLVCQLDDPPQITEETTFQELNLDSLDILALLGATQILHEDGKTSYEPPNTETLLACKTFGGLIDYLIDGKEAAY